MRTHLFLLGGNKGMKAKKLDNLKMAVMKSEKMPKSKPKMKIEIEIEKTKPMPKAKQMQKSKRGY